MTATEIRETLEGARKMLEDESNIVLQSQHFFEDKTGAQLPVGADLAYVDRVCGAGAFLYAAETIVIDDLEAAFAYHNFGITESVISYMTKLVAKHDYGALLDLYDEAITYWSAQEAGVIVTAHERGLIA